MLADFMARHWGSTQMAGHGQLFEVPDLTRRGLKLEIPLTGSFGIPMRDELQLELAPAEWDDFIARYRWPPS